jgi:nucleoside 2-deoxyribosyltransferase
MVAALVQDGHQIPTAHLVESGVGAFEAGIDPFTVYARDVDWIRASDVLIAEVSVPSHGVGYEIAFALGIEKPVLCVHQAGRKVSKMITGNPDANLQVQAYQDSVDATQVIRDFLARILK